jgi:hypothetical protein
MSARTEDRDIATTWATRELRYDAVCARGIPDHALPQRLAALDSRPFFPVRAATHCYRVLVRWALDGSAMMRAISRRPRGRTAASVARQAAASRA